MTARVNGQDAGQSAAGRKKEWAPRIWEGCHFIGWLNLLIRNRFAVNWRYSYIACVVTIVSFIHMVLRWVQTAIFGRRVKRTEIRHAPIFIIGHWRTGTTHLHELLILDPRHGYPNTYQCLEPNHFLLTEGVFRRWFRFLMPSRRPMDNMAAGWDRPQEDEFALCMLGVPSPYLTIAFPNRKPLYPEYLDLHNISPRALARWKSAFLDFLKTLTYKDPRRLVLKSPPHSCRIPVLLEMFPDARFIHIVRDPYVVFPSTVNLWRSLYETHGLQKPTFAGLEDKVIEDFLRINERLEEDCHLLRPERYALVRYEDLVREPVEQMRRLYEQLELGGFEVYLPLLQAYVAKTRGYETNRYDLTPDLEARVTRCWGPAIERQGYPLRASQPAGGPHAASFSSPARA